MVHSKSPTGVTAAASRDLIQRMLECSFSEEWSSWAKARKNVWKPENHEVCEGHRGSDYHQCLRELCQSSVFKVIKVKLPTSAFAVIGINKNKAFDLGGYIVIIISMLGFPPLYAPSKLTSQAPVNTVEDMIRVQ